MSIESFHDPVESEAGPESILVDLDAIAADADRRSHVMESGEERTSKLLDDIRPETPEDERVLADLKERLSALPAVREDLKSLTEAAALDTLLATIASPAEADDGTREEKVARVLADNPSLLETLVRGLAGVTQMNAPESEKHPIDHSAHERLASETKAILDELEAADKKLFKGVALRTAERVARAILSASTLGIGGLVYDSAKDVYVNMQKRKEIRARRKTLLQSASTHAMV